MRVVMKRVSISLSESQMERLRKLSTLRGIPYAELIRRALDEFLDKELGKLPNEREGSG